MEKLGEPTRMRLPDTLRDGVKKVMELEDRRNFGETLCHVLRVGLETKLQGQGKSPVVNTCDPACTARPKPPHRATEWDGVDRRKRA